MPRIASTLRWFRCGAVAVAALAGASTGAAAQISGKWAPYVDLEAMPGTARSIGTADVFTPLFQTDSSLLFANVRGRADDLRNREGNLGLGFRQMEAGGWNVGAYGYVDRLQSSSSNLFDQVTLGAEALGPDWDFRANGYIPAGTTTKPVPTPSATPVLIGGSIEIAAANESALGGFDGEAGWRVPLWDVAADQQLRVYAGAYRFAGTNVPDVAGPRGRVEVTFYDPVPFLPGARITAGGEIQHDAQRGTQAFAMLRVRIPFGGADEPSHRLDAQERRMTDPVVRDVDIVTGVRSYEEPTMSVATGAMLQNVAVVGTGAGEAGVQTTLASNAPLVILDGSGGPLTIASGLTMSPHQMLVGGSASIEVVGVTTGRTMSFSVPGTTPTLQGPAVAPSGRFVTLLTAATGSAVQSINFVGGQFGLMIPGGATGVTVADNSFSGIFGTDIYAGFATNPTSATISGNSFAMSAGYTGIQIFAPAAATTIVNNRFVGIYPSQGIEFEGTSATISNNVFTGAYAGYNGAAIAGGALTNAGSGNDLTGITGLPCIGASGKGSIGFIGPGGVAGSLPASCPPYPTDGGGGVTDTIDTISIGTEVILPGS